MTEIRNDGAWFAPKANGYGAGLPIAWQGWALMIGQLVLMFGGIALLMPSIPAAVGWSVLIGTVPLPLFAAKTRGGWKWRSPKGK